MKKVLATLALTGFALAANVHAFTTNDIQIWTGCGTNHAAMVIEWNSPEVFNLSTVPAPITTKTMVWGYKFNGTATASQMFNSVLTADRRLYAIDYDDSYGRFVEGIGYNLKGDGNYGATDGTETYPANTFVNGDLINSYLDPDAATPLNNGDLFWSGYYGANWNIWTELNQTGGYAAAPDRGTNQYATFDPVSYTWTQGQWESSYLGLDDLDLQDGSWLGLSVGSAGYDTNVADIAFTAYFYQEQAPVSPDGTYFAYVCDTNSFATQVISSSYLDTAPPYNDPTAILGRPTLQFIDNGGIGSTNRTKIIEAPYNTDANGSNVIAEIAEDGQITVQMGHKVYHNPANPYGIDLIVYGNSFFSPSGQTGFIGDSTDLNSVTLKSGVNGHSTTVSVSQDGVNWYEFSGTNNLFPDNAYRWDESNQIWTDEEMNPTKPLNPAVTANSLNGDSVADALDQFIGASGGSGFNLAQVGLPWIQYVRFEPGPNAFPPYTVVDAVAEAIPATVGDALSIASRNISAGITNLTFQNPANSCQNLISINFRSVNETEKISTVELSEFSAFAPVPGCVAGAYQITAAPLTGTNPPSCLADISLSVGTNYSGNGGNLRVLQWSGTAWNMIPFVYNSASNQVYLTGLTNLSAFVVSQLGAQLDIHSCASGLNLVFTPFTGVTYTLQRSTDLLSWTPIATNIPANMQPVTLHDSAPPAGHAYYRVQLAP